MFVEVSRDRRSRLKGIERVWYQFTNFESVLLDRMDQNGLRLIHLGCCHEFHYLKERHWLLKSTFFSDLFIVYWLGFVQGLASFSVKIVATGSVLIAQIHWCIHWSIHPSIRLRSRKDFMWKWWWDVRQRRCFQIGGRWIAAGRWMLSMEQLSKVTWSPVEGFTSAEERNLSLRIWGESAGGWCWGPAGASITTKRWKAAGDSLVQMNCQH